MTFSRRSDATAASVAQPRAQVSRAAIRPVVTEIGVSIA
jgi:hypothetical protein